ncbi:MAG: hypothetical protein ACK4K7_10765 [Allosphingosinicella sp.]|uniref:hypothetical protein n=1 Tax=Allosphingosinicella sp. TaxID=2823234 RepID=UPI0039434520
MADDNQLIEMIENILLTPSSDFYIATILHDPNGGALDPRTIDSIDLGTIDIQGVQIGIVIRNLVVRGLSNVQVAFDADGNPEISVDGDTVTFHAVLPNEQPGYTRPPDVPAVAAAHGDLDVTIAGQPMPPGTILLTISAVEDLTGVFTATEGDGGLSTVEIAFTSLSIALDLPAGVMTIAVDLPTVFKQTINHILNQPDMQASFLDKVNAQLSSQAVLSSLSEVATKEARAALGSS